MERHTKDDWPDILHKVDMDNQGLVTITFSKEVFFPGYMLRKYNSDYTFKGSDSNQESVSGIQSSLQGGTSRLLST